jgi:catechol 2,3-dioxygenase-like lactoylglutathione lyase family enzyme
MCFARTAEDILVLHHVALGAQNVERVAAFYRDFLGLPEDRRHMDGEVVRSIWLRMGSSMLMVERTMEPLRQVDGIGAGPFLLAIGVSSDERTELENRLETGGFPIESRSEFTSYTRDPEKNRVAFSCYPL